MYKIEVISSGKYSNVVLGPRYCLTKKTVIKFAKLLDEVEADYEITKFVRLTDTMFGWTDSDDHLDKIWDCINKES